MNSLHDLGADRQCGYRYVTGDVPVPRRCCVPSTTRGEELRRGDGRCF